MKQQENEREDKAVQALNRALELDPQHGAALLALAVSYTNENDRGGSLGAIERWIDIEANGRYADAVRTHRALNEHSRDANATIIGGLNARQKDLVECLMTMARMSPDGQIDADIQIALGVLLNTSEVSILYTMPIQGKMSVTGWITDRLDYAQFLPPIGIRQSSRLFPDCARCAP